MNRVRYLLLIASLLFHVGIFLLIMNLRVGEAQPPADDKEVNFVAEMKIPAKVVPADPANLTGGASAALAPALISPQAPLPPVPIAITSTTTPNFNVALTSTSTSHSMTQMLNNLTTTERAGNGAGLGPGVNVGGVTVSAGERLGVVLDVSGSMTTILPPIRQTLKDQFEGCQIAESQNSLGQYMPTGSGVDHSDPDLYKCCYNLLGQDVTAIYIFTDFEDGEDKKATAAMVDALRKAEVKLYICYTEGPPYDGLVAYSKESGGDCKKYVREDKK